MYSTDSSATSHPGTTPRAVHTAKSSCYAGVYSGTSPKPVIADEARDDLLNARSSTPSAAARGCSRQGGQGVVLGRKSGGRVWPVGTGMTRADG